MTLFEKLKIYAKRDIKYRNFIDIHRFQLRELSLLYKKGQLEEFRELIESDIDPIEGLNDLFDKFYGEMGYFVYRIKNCLDKKFDNIDEIIKYIDNILPNKKNSEENIIEVEDNLQPSIELDIKEDIKDNSSEEYSFQIEDADKNRYLTIYRDDIIIESFDDFITDLGEFIDSNLIDILKAVKIDNHYYKIGKMGSNSNGFSYNDNPDLYRKVVNKFIKEYLDA